jgi:hypothetical protein
MALKISTFFLTFNQSGFLSRDFTFNTPDFSILVPNGKNVFVEKISIKAIYNGAGDNVIKYYSLNCYLINQQNIIYENKRFKIINPIANQISSEQIFLNINSKLPLVELKENISGLRFNNIFFTGQSGSSLIFNSSGSSLLNSVSFIISLYYKK